MQLMIEPEYYLRYKKVLDECIPREVLNRLLGKNVDGEVMGDAWESPNPPWEV